MAKNYIRLVEVDALDKDNPYYLYEVITDNAHYYVTRSEEDFSYQLAGSRDYSNDYLMYKREDFTNREWEIAKYLFFFLWDSSNGTNTSCSQDIYEGDGFTYEEMKAFFDKFEFENEGVLELDAYEEGAVEIYWDYFSCFDLSTCDFFNEKEA